MEFHEYYQIIRARLAVPLVIALFAVVVAGGLLVLSGKQWHAEGQMLAQPGAAYGVRWAGNAVEVSQDDDAWGTLQQLVESRTVAEQAAAKAGLGAAGLTGLTFDRSRRGNMFTVSGSAGSSEKATAYVTAGMGATSQLWNQSRLQRAEAVRADLQQRADAIAPRRDAVLTRLAAMEEGPNPGKPPDVLSWTQTQIASNDGAVATAAVDVGMARDRLNSLQGFAARERSMPPEQRLMADNATQPVTAGLQARLADLQAQRTTMLQTRTDKHPEVQALDREIADTQKRLDQANDQGGSAPNRVSPTLQQQIVVAEAELGASQRRVDELRSQGNDLRARIPALQARARDYQALLEQFKPLDDERTALLANLTTVREEIGRLQGTEDLQVVDTAQVSGSNRTPKKLVMTIASAFIGGLIIGVLLLFVLHYLDISRPEYTPAKAPV